MSKRVVKSKSIKKNKQTLSAPDSPVQFERLREEINVISARLTQLRDFITEISQKSGFDQEDVERTVQVYKELAMSLQEKEQSLKYREELYTQHIVRLDEMINSRQKFLEKMGSNDLFQTFPELLNFYVEKQATLTDTLEQLKLKLDT
jgi:hypothetical protein